MDSTWYLFCRNDRSGPATIIGCPTSSVAQVNLTIKINFNRLRSSSSSDILTIYLHSFLQSLHPFEKNCIQGLPCDFLQNNPNTNKRFRLSFSTISHQFSFDVAKKEKEKGKRKKGKSPRVSNLANKVMRCLFHSIETDVIR
jgi:hypothetical protein